MQHNVRVSVDPVTHLFHLHTDEHRSDVDIVLLKDITPFGNSAHIPIPVRYKGRKAYIIILGREESERRQLHKRKP